MYKQIIYKNLSWYILNETDKEKLLLMKNCFTNEMIKKYFDKFTINEGRYEVKFNSNPADAWWKDSYIREPLNEKFILDLDKNDLNVMKTTLSLDGKISETEDYVRLLTIEEVENIKREEILITESEYGYWTMTPALLSSFSSVCRVGSFTSPTFIFNNSVDQTSSVRPIISLKPNVLEDEQKLKNELIKMIYILKNNQISTSKWIEYQFKYNSLKNYTASVEIMVLIGILGESLINAKLSALDLIQIDGYNEWKNTTLEELNNSKKLIQLR